MSEQLPETGEGVNGEQLSPLANTPSDIPEYDQEPMTAFLDAQLPGKSPTADILWPGEESGAITININVSAKGANVVEPEPAPAKKDDVPRDLRTGLPIGTVVHGLNVGSPSEADMDRLRKMPLFPPLQRQVPDIGSGMNVNSGPTWKPSPVAEPDGTSPLDKLPEQVSVAWRER